MDKKILTFTELYAIDENNPGRIAKSGETLYLVGKSLGLNSSPTFLRRVKYKIESNAKGADLQEVTPNWTFDKMRSDGVSESHITLNNPVLSSTKTYTNYTNGGYYAASVGFTGGNKNVNVEVVNYYRYGYKGLPGNINQKLDYFGNQILPKLSFFAKKINDWTGSDKVKAEIKSIKITGDKYNEESKSNRLYYDVIKQSVTGGVSIKATTPTLYPPPLAFLNIKGVSEVGAFISGSVEFDISGNRYELTNGETKQIDTKLSKFTIEGKLSGCIEIGLKAQLLVAQDQIEFSASGSGKGCVSGIAEINTSNGTSKLKAQIDPMILAAKVKVKSKGLLKFSLIDYEGSFAITDKIPL